MLAAREKFRTGLRRAIIEISVCAFIVAAFSAPIMMRSSEYGRYFDLRDLPALVLFAYIFATVPWAIYRVLRFAFAKPTVVPR